MVAAEHYLARPRLGQEVTQCLGCEHERVEVQLVQVFRWLLLQFDIRVATRRRNKARVIRARCVRREVPAAMRRDDLKSGKSVEGTLEDQVLQGDRGAKRIADGVG